MTAGSDVARLLIVDDHPLFREALTSAVQFEYPRAEAVEARTIAEALSALSAGSFDLVLLDLNIPGVQGFEGLLQLRTRYPHLPLVVVSGHEEPKIIAEALSYGAAGFIPKSVRRAELSRAIRSVMEGAVYVPESFDREKAAAEAAPDRAELVQRLARLTPQQLRVLQMLRQGLLNKQIAFELQVGETTVKAHVSEILRKLNVYSRTQAVIEVSKLDNAELFREQGF